MKHFAYCIVLLRSSSSLYSFTKLGQGGLFRYQHSRHLVVSSVLVQVVVFLSDNILENICILLTVYMQHYIFKKLYKKLNVFY
jgi:hypothetical protein